MKAGRFRDARVFLEQARAASEEEKIERRFLLGKVYMRLGMPRKASEQFEAILALRLGLTRIRLELANAHYAAGFDEKAKRHFELSLADGLPSSVENAVEGFINAIDSRKRWSLHVSGAILPETNAVRRTDSRTVLEAGPYFDVIEARKDYRSSRLVGLSGGVSRAFRLSGKIVNSSLKFGGFAPYVGYSYERNRSNISLYEYQNHGVLMGLSRDF